MESGKRALTRARSTSEIAARVWQTQPGAEKPTGPSRNVGGHASHPSATKNVAVENSSLAAQTERVEKWSLTRCAGGRRAAGSFRFRRGIDRDALDDAFAHQVVADELLKTADDHLAAAHAGQFELNGDAIAGLNHAAEADLFHPAETENLGPEQVVASAAK